MKKLVSLLSLVLYLICFSACQQSSNASSDMSNSNLTFTVENSDSPPLDLQTQKRISYENLEIIVFIGAEQIPTSYITLEKALEDSLAMLKETSSVNELSLNNLSDQFIFIQSGDIVKGGKQDRTVQYDVIIGPKDKNVPISSFCVESGRWSQRGNEGVGAFSVSKKALPSRSLKYAAKKEGNQQRVWGEVSKNQHKLKSNLNAYYHADFNVVNDSSPTSLQLTLENEKLDTLKMKYMVALQSSLDISDALGMAYAVNGEVYGMDLYNNHALYNDLKEKLLESFVVEAISDIDKTQDSSLPSIQEQLDLWFKYSSDQDLSKSANDQKINDNTRFKSIEFENVDQFITTDLNHSNWLHINFLSQDQEAENNNRVPIPPQIEIIEE